RYNQYDQRAAGAVPRGRAYGARRTGSGSALHIAGETAASTTVDGRDQRCAAREGRFRGYRQCLFHESGDPVTTSTKSVKAVKAPAAPAPASADGKESLLLRKAEGGYGFPALEGVANQFARSLRDLIRALGAPTIQIERAGAEQMSFAEWSASAAPAIFWRYHAPPLKGPVLLAGSRSLLLQLVDIFYGGRGQ